MSGSTLPLVLLFTHNFNWRKCLLYCTHAHTHTHIPWIHTFVIVQRYIEARLSSSTNQMFNTANSKP